MSSHDPVERLRTICRDVGFDLDRAKASLIDRLRLLAKHSETVEDAKRMAVQARAIFRYYDEHRPHEAFSEVEQSTVVLGALLSDVGKTGPAHAGPDEQRLIAQMFAVEGVPDDRVTVREFMATYFPEDADARTTTFESLGLDAGMSIRAFWNLHSGWTLAIADSAGVPKEAVAAAATHHLFDDVNPESIVLEDGRFSREFGENVQFDRPEKLIILLDKYDALRRRGRRSHDEAIQWLRERIMKHPRASHDEELESLLDALDVVAGGGPAAPV